MNCNVSLHFGDSPSCCPIFSILGSEATILGEFNELCKVGQVYEVHQQNNTCIWPLKTHCMDNNLQYLHYLHTKLIKYEYTLQEELPYMIV